jgi:hypothetical protein
MSVKRTTLEYLLGEPSGVTVKITGRNAQGEVGSRKSSNFSTLYLLIFSKTHSRRKELYDRRK